MSILGYGYGSVRSVVSFDYILRLSRQGVSEAEVSYTH